MQGGSLYELDAARNTQSLFSSYFVSSGWLLLEGSRAFQSKTLHMLLTMKNVAKDVIFAR